MRAYLCEALACASPVLARHKTDAFLVGMLSLLDAVLGRPLAELVAELPLSPEARSALLDGTGPLAPLLACAVAYERADWEQVALLAQQFRLDAGEVSAGYFEALAQAQEVFGDVSSDRLPARAAPRKLSRDG